MSETILYIGPVPHTAEQLERLAATAGLSFRSRYAPHELVLVIARERQSAILAFCKRSGVQAITG